MLTCVSILIMIAIGGVALFGIPFPILLTLFLGLPFIAGIIQYRLFQEPDLRVSVQTPALAVGSVALLCQLGAKGIVAIPETYCLSDSEALFAVPDTTLLTVSAALSLVGMILGTLLGRVQEA